MNQDHIRTSTTHHERQHDQPLTVPHFPSLVEVTIVNLGRDYVPFVSPDLLYIHFRSQLYIILEYRGTGTLAQAHRAHFFSCRMCVAPPIDDINQRQLTASFVVVISPLLGLVCHRTWTICVEASTSSSKYLGPAPHPQQDTATACHKVRLVQINGVRKVVGT